MRKLSLITAIMFAFGLFMIPTAFATDDKSMSDKTQSQSQQQQQQQQDKMGQSSQQGKQFQQQAKNLLLVDHLIGTNIMNQNQEQIGEIEKVLVDIEKGKVAYVVLTGGGVLGVGEERYIVPFNALKKQPQAGEQFATDRPIQQTAFTLDMKQDKLKEVPQGDIEEALSQQRQGEEIHQYYGVSPYWEEEGQFDQRQGEREGLQQMQQKDMEKGSEYNKEKDYQKKDRY